MNRLRDHTIRCYRPLLRLFPREFRDQFGSQMEQVFRDLCRREARRHGASGVLQLWGQAFSDAVAAAGREWFEEVRRAKSPWLVVSGSLLVPAALFWALTAGAVAIAGVGLNPTLLHDIPRIPHFLELATLAGGPAAGLLIAFAARGRIASPGVRHLLIVNSAGLLLIALVASLRHS